MKKKFLRIISILFVFVMAITALAGCGSCGGDDDEAQSNVVDNSKGHVDNSTVTDNYLLRNGVTEYYIVYPEDVDSASADAVSELKHFFKQATGIELSAVSDKGLSHDDNRKAFSIGKNNLFKTSGLTVDEATLGNDGHIIKTVGNTIYLVGGGYAGNLYAVYTLLEKAFNYDTLFRDTFTIDKVSDYKLYNYDILEIPDVMARRPGTEYDINKQTDYDELMHYKRLRYYPAKYGTLPIHEDFFPESNKGVTHNAPCYVPAYIYKADHPKWYSTAQPEDLCYTAHGDEAELELMITECAKKIQYSLKLYSPKSYPHMNIAIFQKLDQPGECSCDGCMADKATYGTQSASVIKFVNRVSLKVDEWMAQPENAEYKRINFKVMFLAYHQFSEPPVNYNEDTGEYEPVDDSVIFVKNAGVQHAPIYDYDTQSPLYSEVNAGGLETMKRWQAVTQEEGSYGLWAYGVRFTRSIYFYDTFNFYNNDYFRFLYQNNRAGLFFNERSGSVQGMNTTFENLKDYIESKLAWNCNVDMNALIDKWFNGMFGEAAPYVKQYFDELRMHTRKTAEENDMIIVNSMYFGINAAKYWPYNLQNSWVELFDQAYQAIEPLQNTDPELYEKLYRNVSSEYIAPTYILINFYKDDMSLEQKTKTFNMITQAAKITKISSINGMETTEYLRKLYE